MILTFSDKLKRQYSFVSQRHLRRSVLRRVRFTPQNMHFFEGNAAGVSHALTLALHLVRFSSLALRSISLHFPGYA